ncbi:MAG: rod shape-determining protein MreD [Pseudomonadota bacterium]
MAKARSPFFALIWSVAAALLMSILPLPDILQPWRPEWLTLVLLFWVMHAPNWVGLWFGMAMGLLLDVLLASPLGMHASTLVVVIYVARMTQRWSGVFSVRQTTALVFLLILLGRLMTYAQLALRGEQPSDLTFFLPAVASALIWPTVLLSLRRWTQR